MVGNLQIIYSILCDNLIQSKAYNWTQEVVALWVVMSGQVMLDMNMMLIASSLELILKPTYPTHSIGDPAENRVLLVG